MRLWLGGLIVVMLAGCLDADPRPETRLEAPCDFAYPDGKSIDCSVDLVTHAAGVVPDGFFCTAQHDTDETHGHERTWAHHDGRVGVSWSWPEHGKQGIGIMSATLLEDGQRVHRAAHLSDRGFIEMPAPNGEDAEILTWMRFFVIEGPGASEARLHMGEHAGHPWFWWEVPTEGGSLWFDLMKENDDPSLESLAWYPGEHVVGDYNMTQWSKGVKYKPGAAHITGLTNRWCPDPLGSSGPAGADVPLVPRP